MASPSPFIPPRPLSGSGRPTPAVETPVIPPYAQGQSPGGGSQLRGRQPAGYPAYPQSTPYSQYAGSPYHIPQGGTTLAVPNTPTAPAGNAGFSSDWTGFPTESSSSSSGTAPHHAPALGPGLGPAPGMVPGFAQAGPTPPAAQWSLPPGFGAPGYGSAPATGYMPYQPLPPFGFPGYPGMGGMPGMGVMPGMGGMPGMPGMAGMPGVTGVPVIPQATPAGPRTSQAFPANTPAMGGWPPQAAGPYATPYPPPMQMQMQMPPFGFTPFPAANVNLPAGFGPPPPGAVPPPMSRRSSRHAGGRARSVETMDHFDKWLAGATCKFCVPNV